MTNKATGYSPAVTEEHHDGSVYLSEARDAIAALVQTAAGRVASLACSPSAS